MSFRAGSASVRRDKEYEGGSLEKGKTSNRELDTIYQRYLPKHKVVPCHTFPTLDQEKVALMTRLVHKHGEVFFPIFVRHHWIAGVLKYTQNTVKLTIFDSAPSPIVHRDIRKAVRDIWPTLEVEFGYSPRQERDSDDCGIFMSILFFSLHYRLLVDFKPSMPAAVRALMSSALKASMGEKDFRMKMTDILCRDAPVTTPAKQRHPVGKEYSGGAPKPRQARASKVFKQPKGNGKPDPKTNTGRLVSEVVHQTLQDAGRVEASIAKRQLCYFLVGTALVNVGDGAGRSLGFNPLCSQVHRKGFRGSTQYDVGEVLDAYKVKLDLLCTTKGAACLEPREGRSSQDAIYVLSPQRCVLPNDIDGWSFRLGAFFSGDVGAHGARSGHYTLTTESSKAVVGVYLPRDMTRYPAKREVVQERTRQATRTFAQMKPASPPTAVVKDPFLDSAESSVGPDVEEVQIVEELIEEIKVGDGDSLAVNRTLQSDAGADHAEEEKRSAMMEPTTTYLNRTGRLNGGVVTCPRSWYIYQDKPPHVSQLAWAAITPQMRGLHRKWLREIRAMPADLLNRNLPQAALELVRRQASARGWKWSTTAKVISAISAALLNLPLYTNQTEGVDVMKCPEWRAASQAAHRFERESVPNPPPEVTLEQYQSARKVLGTKFPVARLFMGMMWCFAARAGDITSLQGRDINFSRPLENGTVPVSLTIRRGKAAKMRGPYPVASVLLLEDASLLKKLITEVGPYARIFCSTQLREQVRGALHQLSPEAALPSLRKGAVRHLADMGIPESELMRMTGHTREDTLRRYLGYGLHLTKEGAVAQVNAGLALQQPNNSDPRHRRLES